MSRRKQVKPAPPPTSDEVLIYGFQVGHGDCTLIEYHHERTVRFRLLTDGGESLPPSLVDHLKRHPRVDGGSDIDVLVLTHVDSDHQGGLASLAESSLTIGQYLGPCLPTLKRLSWLFAERVQAAVDRAVALESALKARRVPVNYPMEGYSDRFAERSVTISVISPAARLLEKLSTADGGELGNLLMRSPLPLQWLLEVESDATETDDQGVRDAFRGRTVVTSDDLPLPLQRPRGVAQEDVQQGSAALVAAGIEPEYFGNAVLNDTSIVMLVDVHLDTSHRRRILLTGDQENWSYICARHPAGLGIDLLKAPHHGGRVYLDDQTEAIERLYLWLRPRTVLVSANGRHQLPRVAFRDAMQMCGAALVCPNRRGMEPLTAGAKKVLDAKSCFDAYGCTEPLTKERDRSVVTLSAGCEHAAAPTCLQGSGHRGAAPIVVLQQSLIEPSDAFVRWTLGELEKHARWIQRKLNAQHREETNPDAFTEPDFLAAIARPPATWAALAALARSEGRHEIVVDPEPVLRYGSTHRYFWTSRSTRREPDAVRLSRLPSKPEVARATEWLSHVPNIIVFGQLERRWLPPVPRVEILQACELQLLAALLAVLVGVPLECVDTDVLPELLPALATQFNARCCDPSSRWGALPDDGRVLLHLMNRSITVPIPDLLDFWLVEALRAQGAPNGGTWQALFQTAASSVLIGPLLALGKDHVWKVSKEWLNDFGLGRDFHGNSKVVGRFDETFMAMNWRTLWE